tara:strand:- start:323 stop:502 length:180 start_codon:yes stop_codon:yes gene_type:complete
MEWLVALVAVVVIIQLLVDHFQLGEQVILLLLVHLRVIMGDLDMEQGKILVVEVVVLEP